MYRLWLGEISYGTMILFIQMASYLSNSFSGLIGLIPRAINATTSAGRIIKITDFNLINREKDRLYLPFLQS